MGKIALLVSREEMLYLAHNILQEKPFAAMEMRVIETKDSVVEARNSIAGGASIIIARGLQASLMKQYTDIPVVEIAMTAQEMGLLVMKARQIVKKTRPVIAVVGFPNMFCDMSYFETLYDIELRTYYAPRGEELPWEAERAVEERADLLIGGDTAVEAATKAGVPSLFLSITEDSLRNAFSMAERVDYAMSVEKKNAAQMETVMDYSCSGVVRLDADGIITMVNPLMEEMLGKQEAELTGKHAVEVFSEIDREVMRQVFAEGRDHSMFMTVLSLSVFAVLAPIPVDGRVDGAILTCHKMKRRPVPDGGTGRKRRDSGVIPLAQFEDIAQNSEAMKECVRLAKLFALSEKPVVIMGEPGTEKLLLAQSIHNSGLHSDGPFLDVPCAGLPDETQRETIFGDLGAAVSVNGGSLLIQDVDCLTSANQYRLYQLIRHHICRGANAAQTKRLDVRVMVTAGVPLDILALRGDFRWDLYYLLAGMTLNVPPFRDRKEDLRQKIEACMREGCERYGRYHVLSQGAWKVMLDYPWTGNLFQIETFCERLILTADKRNLDEVQIARLLRELYGGLEDCADSGRSETGNDRGRVMSDGERELYETLCRFDGSRQRTAEALGISKATLWRRMKRYGMEQGHKEYVKP